jgi:hypothetical protein
MGLLPARQAYAFSRIEPWGFYIVMGLVVAGIVSSLWLSPLIGIGYGLLNVLLSPLKFLLK